jgi:16S rRNA (cytosine1402-N4)-methyltransferase
MNFHKNSYQATKTAFDLSNMHPPELLFQHISVMPKEVLDNLALFPGAIAVDVTAGGGGHLALMAKQIGTNGRLIAFDRDNRAHAQDAAGGIARKYGNIELVHAPFSELHAVLEKAGISKVDALLCDLGVSSLQLDDSTRGFSFTHDGPLDMRMDTSAYPSAYELIRDTKEKELADIIYTYGEERKSRRIAHFIKKSWPLPNSTSALARIVTRARGGQREKIHPATRTFQALRIAVNGELEELAALLKMLPDILSSRGRAVFISFHSLEDRLIKQAFKKGSLSNEDQPALWRLLQKRPLIASKEETAANSRSRSAKLRAIEKLDLILEKPDAK